MPAPVEPDADFDPNVGTFYPAVEFELRKKGHSKELVLDKLYLKVTKYQEAPTDVYQAVHQTSFTSEVVVCATVARPDTVPHIFPVTTVIRDGEAEDFSTGQISFKDEFANRLKVIVQAKDPGIYTFSIIAEFSGDNIAGYTRELTEQQISFLYLPIVPNLPAPKPGEETVWVGRGNPSSRKRSQKAKAAANTPVTTTPGVVDAPARSKLASPTIQPGLVPK